jgi:hypothetical protein
VILLLIVFLRHAHRSSGSTDFDTLYLNRCGLIQEGAIGVSSRIFLVGLEADAVGFLSVSVRQHFKTGEGGGGVDRIGL